MINETWLTHLADLKVQAPHLWSTELDSLLTFIRDRTEYTFEAPIGSVCVSGLNALCGELKPTGATALFLPATLFDEEWEKIGNQDLFVSLHNLISRYEGGRVKLTLRIDAVEPNQESVDLTLGDVISENTRGHRENVSRIATAERPTICAYYTDGRTLPPTEAAEAYRLHWSRAYRDKAREWEREAARTLVDRDRSIKLQAAAICEAVANALDSDGK